MNRNTKDTASISLVALILVLVALGALTCGIILATPFLVEWIVKFILLLILK